MQNIGTTARNRKRLVLTTNSEQQNKTTATLFCVLYLKEDKIKTTRS